MHSRKCRSFVPGVEPVESRSLMSGLHPGNLHAVHGVIAAAIKAKPTLPKPPKPPSGWPSHIVGTMTIEEKMYNYDASGILTDKYLNVYATQLDFAFSGKSKTGQSLIYKLMPGGSLNLDLGNARIIRNVDPNPDAPVIEVFNPSQGSGEVKWPITMDGTLTIIPLTRHVVKKKVHYDGGVWDLDANIHMSYQGQKSSPEGPITFDSYEAIPVQARGNTVEVSYKKPKQHTNVFVNAVKYEYTDISLQNPKTQYTADIRLIGRS